MTDSSTLQQNDVDSLLDALAASGENAEGQEGQSYHEVKIYDFAQPDNLPSEFLRALETMNTSLARAWTGMFIGLLATEVTVDPLAAEQITYRQLCNAIPEISAIGVYALSPLEGSAIIELNPHLAWYCLDCGLGGTGEMPETSREFTPLERGLLDDLFRRMLRELGKCWEHLLPLHPTLREVITNAAAARIAQPDDRLVVCSFSVNLGAVSGICTYAIPVGSLDFERLLNSDSSWDNPEEADPMEERRQINASLLQAAVPLRACLRDVTITLGELASLQEGDVIHLDAQVEEPIDLRVANLPCFLARPSARKDVLALDIIGEQKENDYGRTHH
ncbi:MAG: flagellar motor switch protein FliM [Armatimonadota bacterium]